MLTRRRLLRCGPTIAGLGTSVACSCAAYGQQFVQSRGCLLTAEDANRIQPLEAVNSYSAAGLDAPISHSQDRIFDRALAQSLARVSEVLVVTPGFGFYDDHDAPNAYALPQVRLGGADGTVLFGLRFLDMLRRAPEHPEVGVVAVCAHEFGHILQFKHGLWSRVQNGAWGAKRIELQADYFAGYFIGIRRKERPNFPAAVAALTHFRLGDTAYNSPSHHGTPDERAAAFIRGYDVAFRENRSLSAAIEIGVQYAMVL